MASKPYESGAGGKFRKLPFRKAASKTPYDRPPTALRPSQQPASAPPRNGWLSKLVEPASRLFSSVFLKILPAPPVVTEYNQQGQGVPQVPQLIEKPSDEVQDHFNDNRNTMRSHDGAQLGVNSHSHGTFELGELLKQKTFTRAEFEQLSGLLESRMVESSQSTPDNSLEQIRKLNVSELTNKKHQMVLQSERAQLPNEDDVEGEMSLHPRNEHPNLNQCLTPTLGNVINQDSTASPAEVAKAYMGSRSSKAVPATRGIRNLILQENRQLSNELSYGKNSFDLSLVPSPAIAGTPKVSDTVYPPRIHGRSAMHRMSRSPFFKLQTSAHYMGGSTYELTPTGVIQSENKKALKRRISDLDDNVASSGHLRRIRQKHHVTTPLSKLSSVHTLPSWDQHGKDARTFAGSGQKPLYLEGRKDAGKESIALAKDIASPVSIIPVPLQSSEMARKIFQQLDQLMPSPKEKSPEVKVADRIESPSKLTSNMLHGRAVKSMQKIDSPNFLEVLEIGNLGAVCGDIQESVPGLITETHGKGEEKGLLEQCVVGLEVAPEAFDKGKSAIIVSDVESCLKDSQFASGGAANFAISNKPAFRISAPEDFFDLDDENNELEDSSNLAVRRDNKLDLKSESQPVNGETADPEKHTEPLSKPMSTSSKASERDLDKKVSDRTVPQNNTGFKVAGSISSSAEICSLPPVSSVSFNNSDPPKEKVTDDSAVVGNSSIKFGERATWSSNATVPEEKISEKRSKHINGESLFTTFGGASSGLPTTSASPLLSVSGDSVTIGLSGDIPPVTSNTLVSVPTAANFNNSVTSVANNISATISSTSPSISTAASVYSLFQFDSSTSLVASKPFVQTASKLDTITQGTGSASASFGINDVATPITSKPPFSSASNTSALSSVFSSVSSSSSASLSSLISSSGSAGSAPSTSASSNSDNKLFAFGAPSTSVGLASTISSNGRPSLGTLFQSNSSTNSISETQPANSVSLPSQGSSSQFGSFPSTAFGFAGSSSSTSSSLLNTAADPMPSLGASTGFSFSSASGISSSSISNPSFAPVTTFGSSGFSLSAGAFSSSTSASGSSLVSGNPFSSGSGFSLTTGVVSSSTSSNSTSVVPSASTSLFTSSASTAPSSLFGATFGSTTPSPVGFSFGSSAPSSGSLSFTFSASSGSAFSSNSAGNTNSLISPTQPVFGVSNQFANPASASPGNDQMNMEDSMADDPVQPSMPTVSSFGQPTNAPTTPNFMFGSPAIPSTTPTFQFGNQQNFSVPQNPSPFQNSGNLEFAGGSFSLGSADKAGRRIVRAKRDKHRKK